MVDAPEDAKKKKDWLRDDARLYLQIENSIENEIIGLVDHCESIKELLEFLDFLYSSKELVHRMFEMVVMIFLNGLLPEFGMANAQILSDSKIPSLDDAFTRVFRIESSPNGVSIPQSNSALISKNNNPQAPRAMDGNVQRKSYDHRKPYSTEIVCNHCRKPGHIKRDCQKLFVCLFFVDAFLANSSSSF
ncbi:putative Polyprotein [Cucumis melo var. makuwa]|uniref:Polyprotein n=1 Tax=Cucumis melo var. makuwa TaxID=1194695 RepID=A0A5D3BK98_CUCMM|nr:putative Polyprotein [Cucumis melo var. makuwa]TYJ99434.1 putative Polyprotein [Cucumis melo var. makuwa]